MIHFGSNPDFDEDDFTRWALAILFNTLEVSSAPPAAELRRRGGIKCMERTFDRLLRIWDILGDPHANPPIKPMVSVSKSTWWAGVKSGKFPNEIKLGSKMTCWRASEILAFINSAGSVNKQYCFGNGGSPKRQRRQGHSEIRITMFTGVSLGVSGFPLKRRTPDPIRVSGVLFGAGNEGRTRDIQLGKLALYQLSYSRGRSQSTTSAGKIQPPPITRSNSR